MAMEPGAEGVQAGVWEGRRECEQSVLTCLFVMLSARVFAQKWNEIHMSGGLKESNALTVEESVVLGSIMALTHAHTRGQLFGGGVVKFWFCDFFRANLPGFLSAHLSAWR